MGLSGIMGKADLAIYAEIGLVIFLAVFAAVVWNTFRKGKAEEHEQASRIPLDDEIPVHERRETTSLTDKEARS